MLLNSKVKEIIEKLENEGYETYVVGGSTRDSIMERPTNDYDLVTTASLDEIRKVLSNEHFVSYQKGLTLGLIYNKSLIDISTTNEKTIEEDLKRRDFTINSILYHPKRGWIDKIGGRKDIENKVIRSIGNPDLMISADPIRILRAIRFEAILNFKIDDSLFISMNKNKELLHNVAKERISQELNKIILVDEPSKYIKKYIDIFDIFIPGIKLGLNFEQKSKYHIYTVLDHTLRVVDVTSPILILRLAALFHDIEKPNYFTVDDKGIGHFYGHDQASAEYSKKVLTNLKYPYKDIQRIYNIIKFHDYRPSMEDKSLLKFLHNFGTEDLDLLFALKRADIIAQHPSLIDRVNDLDLMYDRLMYLIETNQYITKANLEINARDLIEIGYPKNALISKALDKILIEVRNKRLENNHEILVDYARKLISFD